MRFSSWNEHDFLRGTNMIWLDAVSVLAGSVHGAGFHDPLAPRAFRSVESVRSGFQDSMILSIGIHCPVDHGIRRQPKVDCISGMTGPYPM